MDPLEQWSRRRRRIRVVWLIAILAIPLCLLFFPWNQEALTWPAGTTPSRIPDRPREPAKIVSIPSVRSDAGCDPLCVAMDTLDDARLNGWDCPEGASYAPGEPLEWDDDLEDIALDQAEFLVTVGYLSHQTPDSPLGRTVADRLVGLRDVQRSGEVLYQGSGRGEAAMSWWLESAHHCPLLMDPEMTGVGIGRVDRGEGVVWVGLVAN